MFSPGATASSMTTPSPSARVHSTMQTASAPFGRGAPVVIAIASPACSATSATVPAVTAPARRRRAGATAASSARSA